MKITIAQLKPTKFISKNTDSILNAIKAISTDVIVFPEGMLSGYEVDNKNWLNDLSFLELKDATNKIASLAKQKRINVIFGSAWQIKGHWYNCGLYINHDGKLQYVYPKVNLATLDRLHFLAGNSLQTFEIDNVTVAMQICREIRYPEQWRFLTINGAKIIFHLNNAQKPTDSWKHLFITRAYENQIFVVSANAAGNTQVLPSFIIDPEGNVLAKTKPGENELVTVNLQLNKVKTDFIDQRRHDVIDIISKSSS